MVWAFLIASSCMGEGGSGMVSHADGCLLRSLPSCRSGKRVFATGDAPRPPRLRGWAAADRQRAVCGDLLQPCVGCDRRQHRRARCVYMVNMPSPVTVLGPPGMHEAIACCASTPMLAYALMTAQPGGVFLRMELLHVHVLGTHVKAGRRWIHGATVWKSPASKP
eukprot:363132-Chlamydomonas_euryale.AAC.24